MAKLSPQSLIPCFHFYFLLPVYVFILVVSVLSYLLTEEGLTAEEANGHAIDVIFSGVDTVSFLETASPASAIN